MYGQFHNEQAFSNKRSAGSTSNHFAKKEGSSKKVLGFISIFLILVSLSSNSFAGPKQPKLKGGNGNAQGR